MTDEQTYYVADGERTVGPLSLDRVMQAIRAGKLRADTRVCVVGTSEWRTLGELPTFSPAFSLTPLEPAPVPTPSAGSASPATASTRPISPRVALLVVALATVGISATVYWVTFGHTPAVSPGATADLPEFDPLEADRPAAPVATHPFRALAWGMTEQEALAALGPGGVDEEPLFPMPPEVRLIPGTSGGVRYQTRWTCTAPHYALVTNRDEEAVASCFSPLSELASAPMSVVYFRGEPVPGSVGTDVVDGRCGARDPRPAIRAGRCAWTEDVLLVFWQARLVGLSFYPFGYRDRPADVPHDMAAIERALDGRFGPGRAGSSTTGACVAQGVPAAGFERRCQRWSDARTLIEAYSLSYSGDLEYVVAYRDREAWSRIDEFVAGAAARAARTDAERAAAATEAAATRL